MIKYKAPPLILRFGAKNTKGGVEKTEEKRRRPPPIKKLNISVLFEFIKLLQHNEGTNLTKNYMATHYRNYNKLKDIIGADNTNFTSKLNKFLIIGTIILL